MVHGHVWLRRIGQLALATAVGFAALMNPGSVDGMDYWSVVALRVEGIGRRENTVVIRACFSYQAEPFTLGLRDKSDNFTHIRLQLQCRVAAGVGS